MIRSFKRKRWLLLTGDVALILLATHLSSLIRFGQTIDIFSRHTGASVITLSAYIVVIYIFDLYNIGRDFRLGNTSWRIAIVVVVTGTMSIFVFYSFPNWKLGRGIFLIQMILVFGLMNCWRGLYAVVFQSSGKKKSVLIIGAGYSGVVLNKLLADFNSPYRVVGFLDDDPSKQGQTRSPKIIGTTDQLMEIASQRGIDTAILAIPHVRSAELIKSLLKVRLTGITILEMPKVFEQLTRRIPVEHIHNEWLLFTDGFYLVSKQYIQKIKRLIDFGITAFLLPIILPIIAVSALAIRLDSPGPIFFKQDRVGKDNNIFTLWKLRTMKQNSEENGPVWAKKNDSRVTRVGKWLRLLRIDELPQLYNVLCAEMTFIGPRPERPIFVRDLEAQIPYYSFRHSIKPGITGWAQVNYPYGSSVKDAIHKLEYDLYYIKNMGFILDFRIILKTIGVVIIGQGAR